MKYPTDEELILLYYGEHEDSTLGPRVAQSPELQARMDRLTADLAQLDHYAPPACPPDYGQQVWQALLPELIEPQGPVGLFARLRAYALHPRLSLAGGLAVFMVAAVAFVIGQNFQPAPSVTIPGTPATQATVLDGRAILMQQVAGHLGATDRLLTTYVNETQRTQSEAAWAQELLLSNRLYRQAASAAGHKRIVQLLAEIEPLLIEMANQSEDAFGESDASPSINSEQTLLFKVRASRTQLQDSI